MSLVGSDWRFDLGEVKYTFTSFSGTNELTAVLRDYCSLEVCRRKPGARVSATTQGRVARNPSSLVDADTIFSSENNGVWQLIE